MAAALLLKAIHSFRIRRNPIRVRLVSGSWRGAKYYLTEDKTVRKHRISAVDYEASDHIDIRYAYSDDNAY
jgi:hypothetical protein